MDSTTITVAAITGVLFVLLFIRQLLKQHRRS
jgi:hypothetical protein